MINGMYCTDLFSKLQLDGIVVSVLTSGKMTVVQVPLLLQASAFLIGHISRNRWTQTLIFEQCSSVGYIF